MCASHDKIIKTEYIVEHSKEEKILSSILAIFSMVFFTVLFLLCLDTFLNKGEGIFASLICFLFILVGFLLLVLILREKIAVDVENKEILVCNGYKTRKMSFSDIDSITCKIDSRIHLSPSGVLIHSCSIGETIIMLRDRKEGKILKFYSSYNNAGRLINDLRNLGIPYKGVYL